MESALSAIAALPEKVRGDRYSELIEDKLGMGDSASLVSAIDHLTSEEVLHFIVLLLKKPAGIPS